MINYKKFEIPIYRGLYSPIYLFWIDSPLKGGMKNGE